MTKINITKTLISCLTLFFTIQNITAQDFLPKEAPTPNAASLGKYGDIPISYPNGNISLTIPIYTMSSRGLEMPILLSYNTAGVNLNTPPSWTGENWVLNAGGVITRQVNGEPDEWVCPTELTYHNQVHNYFESYDIIPNMVKTNNYQGLIDDELFAAKEEAYKFGLKRHDYQPDIFTFNVMGKSGKFYLGNEGFWRVACDENMEVIYDIKNEQLVSPFIKNKPGGYAMPKVIPGFRLRDDQGYIYQFGYDANAIDYTIDFFRASELYNKESFIATSWYLTKITDNHIIIYNTYNPDYFIRINFDYDFSSRMHLAKLSIKEPRGDGYSDSKSYDFSYNNYDKLPVDYLTRAIDHWGYYNGTEYTVPITNYTTFFKQREPHRSYNSLGMLTKIKYPTGGVSKIMYDTNTYTQKLNENRVAYIKENKDGGGVRVHSITEYEDESLSTIIKKKSFSYYDPKTNNSSGILFASPKYVWYDWRGTPAFGNAQTYLSTFRTSSLIPLSNSFGPAIGYSYIREENLDGSYTILHYSNIEPSQDLPYSVKFSDKANFPNQHFTERGYLRGKLLDITNYNSKSQKVDKTSYTYKDCGNNQDSILVTDIGVVGSNYYCAWIGGIYTLRYTTLKPTTITHTIYNKTSPNDSIVTTDSYTYSYNKNFNTVFNSTFNNKANTTLITQHLQKRGNETERTVYSYNGDSNYNKLAPNFHVLCPAGQITTRNNQQTENAETKYQEITTTSNVKVPVPAATIEHYNSCSDTLYIYTDYTNTGLLAHCISQNGNKISFGYDNTGNYLLWKAVGHDFYSHGKFPSPNVFLPGKLRDTFRMQLYNTSEMNFTLYSYDYLFGINSITLPDASMTTYKYKGGKLSSVIDNAGKEIHSFYFIYDKAGRIIFSQDGNLRKEGKYVFYLYDFLGRKVVRGICTLTTIPDLKNMIVTASYASNGKYAFYDANIDLSNVQLLNAYYYASYSVLSYLPDGYKKNLERKNIEGYYQDQGMTWHPNLKNLQTVTLTYEVDNRSNFYAKTFYYDTKGRIVQTHENNSFDGWEDYYYDVNYYTGAINKSLHRHSIYPYSILEEGTDTIVIEKYRYTYDCQGRLDSTIYQLNDNKEYLVAKNVYDFMGNITKTIGNAPNDNKKYIVTNKNDAKIINSNNKNGNTTPVAAIASAVSLPSVDNIKAADYIYEQAEAKNIEYGYYVASTGEISSIFTDNQASAVKTGEGINELTDKGLQPAFDVHVHPTDIRQDINDNTKYHYGDPRPSGSNGDCKIRRIREQNNFVSEPSWVLGTEVLLNTNPPSKGNRIITFYNSQGNISTINWNNFKRTIQKVRKQ